MELKDLNYIEYSDKQINITYNKEYTFINEYVADIEKILNSSKEETIIVDLFAKFRDQIKGLKKANSISDFNQVIKQIKASNKIFAPLKEFKETKSDKNFSVNRDKIYKEFLKSLKSFYATLLDIQKLHKTYKGINKVHSLYLGYGLMVGYVAPNKPIHTFIMNKKVKLEYDSDNIRIKITVYPIWEINKYALMYIFDNVENLDFEVKFKFSNLEEVINYLSTIYETTINSFEFNNYALNTDKFINGFISIIKCFSIVHYDLNEPNVNKEIKQLKHEDINIINQSLIHDHHYYQDLEIKNPPLVQINQPLNIYQKYALRSAINENTLIYGPPGTGKSEIITNIIANLLDNNKTVLFSCQQLAALDVVYSRLKELRDFCLYVDGFANQTQFYAQIQKMAENIGSLNDPYENSKHISRSIDYTNLNEELKEIVEKYLSFCDLKDHNNNDYKKYLLAYNSANEFMEDNKQLIADFYNDYKNKYAFLQNEVEFIAKVSQYSIFLDEYSVDDLAVNQLEVYRKKFLDYLVLQNLVSRPYINYEDLKMNVDKFHHFLSDFGIVKDKQFMVELNENYGLLYENYQIMLKIRQLLKDKVSNISDKEIDTIVRWIINHAKTHDKFMENLKRVAPNQYIYPMINYYKKDKISSSVSMFVNYHKKDAELQAKYLAILDAISLFRDIKLTKNNTYLNFIHLEEYEQIFNPITVYFYFNKPLLNPIFIAYYNEKIVCFDQAIINRYYLNKLNQIDHYLKVVNSYQFEVLNKNKHAIVTDFDDYINYYLKTNYDYVLRLNNAIYSKILMHIKNKVLDLNNDQKQKIIEMFKIANNDANYIDIKEFINHYYEQLKILFPVWILTPNLLSQLTPLQKGIFDVGIIDEASQLLLKKSYPILYRINQAIVCGDPKQLQPHISKLVAAKTKIENANIANINLNDAVSLIDRVKTAYWNTYYLKNHYRSYSHELIDFSNNNYYDNQLIYVSKNNNNIVGYEIIKVENAICNYGINNKEINAIISLLIQLVNDFETNQIYKDYLVIVFNSAQANALIKQLEKSPVKYDQILKWIKTKKLKIGDLESLQGSEADFVILATTYTENSEDVGLLSTPQAKNYLNVAVSRAKKKMVVISSIEYENIKDSWDSTRTEFMKYLGYCDQIAKNKTKKSSTNYLDNSISNSSYKNELVNSLNNYFKKHKLSFKAISNLNVGSFVIDIAIYSKSINNIDLVILTNDFKKHLTFDDFLIDLDKYNLLIARNYPVLWVNETDYLKDKNLILDKVLKNLKNK